jgi:hypothetical protein
MLMVVLGFGYTLRGAGSALRTSHPHPHATDIAWCPYVTVAPLLTRRRVLSRGIVRGLRGTIAVGGHWVPSSTVGDRELWKYAQNTLTTH